MRLAAVRLSANRTCCHTDTDALRIVQILNSEHTDKVVQIRSREPEKES